MLIRKLIQSPSFITSVIITLAFTVINFVTIATYDPVLAAILLGPAIFGTSLYYIYYSVQVLKFFKLSSMKHYLIAGVIGSLSLIMLLVVPLPGSNLSTYGTQDIALAIKLVVAGLLAAYIYHKIEYQDKT